MSSSAPLTGVSVVGVGSFNPAIFHPTWLRENELLAPNDVEDALRPQEVGAPAKIVVTPELTRFTAGWLEVQVTTQQLVLSTVEEAREYDLRDVVKGVFELLPHTPVTAIGINADLHFLTPTEGAWHALGDTFLPKERWEPLFESGGEWLTREEGRVVGLRAMVVEGWRPDRKDYVRVEVAPSVRIGPHGVYIGINSHLHIGDDDQRGTAFDAAEVLAERWDDIRSFEKSLQEQLRSWA